MRGEGLASDTMLRNRSALPILQKTYDESYLTCSTAVYYESQGDEKEAMRCWKSALDNISDHNAHKVTPTYVAKSETESALIESLKKLELQCKERIDLLEALRVSRQDDATYSPRTPVGDARTEYNSATDAQTRHTSSTSNSNSSNKGWIGGGTIPAITYPELSRPALPHRPSLSTRTSSELAVVGPRHFGTETAASSSSPRIARYAANSPRKISRSPSPEKYTMRTTLRSAKSGDKSVPRKSVSKSTDEPGASKAATLAWGALGSKDTLLQRRVRDDTPERSRPSALHEAPSHSSRKVDTPSKRKWDSHSRRLIKPKEKNIDDDEPAESSHSRLSIDSTRADDILPRSSAHSATTTPSGLVGVPSGSRDSERTQRHRVNLDHVRRNSSRSYRREDFNPSRHEAKASSSPSLPIHRKSSRSHREPDSSPSLGQQRKSTPLRRTTSGSSPGESDCDAILPRSHRKVSERRKPSATNSGANSHSNSRSASEDSASDEPSPEASWKKKKHAIMKNLPPGVDKNAAKQILNEIVVQGDEVHWDDIAGLEVAKNALREAVVYPFLRPDLFMGLREPARGMLLFGPPGTGKTMLARAVATESKSTFFSISASSLTSKYLGESEKLVRALFGLAKVLAPSIIFVDEIDSLLSQRSGSGEHEATRRIKTEFLIQWSDLQRAAAGRDTGPKDRGDPNRVLVLAATNLPWAIDEAARRRFVRRQYIPLPEAETRALQFQNLLGQQKHGLTEVDMAQLVEMTDGFSGSDITALAKDAAMGPLRSLGEALLHMTMEDIRPMELSDFVASLATIRPSVSKAGLKEYEDWATEFGERGG